jgi:hypothetical protein
MSPSNQPFQQPGQAQVEPQARQMVPLTLEMVDGNQVKPGDTLTPTENLVTNQGTTIFTAGQGYKVMRKAPQYSGGLMLESDVKKPWYISFQQNGWADKFQKTVFTQEEQQFQFLTQNFGELPSRILGILAANPRPMPYQTLQMVLIQNVYRGQDTTELTPEITKAFQNLRDLGLLAVAKNKNIMITPQGKKFLAFK